MSDLTPAPPLPRKLRFYDTRQKYLLFVTTCSEKWVVAQRVGMEADALRPKPPALRVFDAGMGDGTVLTRVMRHFHVVFRHVPFYLAAKEISIEDVRLSLEKMPDRFYEHPQTVLVVSNMRYSEAPWLAPASGEPINWHEIALQGDCAYEFDEQIKALQPLISDGWKVRLDERTGNPVYEKPSVLVLYRHDHRFVLDEIIPRAGGARADYDLVIASQPYRAKVSARFKVQRVLAPLALGLGPGGRMLVIQSYGADPGLEIIQKVWPEENPFTTRRHELTELLRAELAAAHPDLHFEPYPDERSLFQFHMHALPSELQEHIGTSSLLAAWNAAAYVAQIDEHRFAEAIADGRYLAPTTEVLRKHGGLWFNNESFAVSRR
jgi:hypothetical protein